MPVSLSKTNLTQGAIRIVLTWLVEGDLDAHLFMWDESRHIYWHDRGDCANLTVDLACLENRLLLRLPGLCSILGFFL